MQELKITMLGASGVGKTTLLTVMYEQFESCIDAVNLQLTPDNDTSAILQERLAELKSLLNQFTAKGRVGIEGTEALAGPQSLQPYVLDIGKIGKEPSLRLSFHDFPGIYLSSNASSEEKEFVNSLIEKSSVILIAIDAPALMERGGKYHDLINKPQAIKDYFKKNLKSLQNPKMVIFAPVKCEKYLQTPQKTQELIDAIRKGYSNLIKHFQSSELNPWIVSILTPVQTVGEVIFYRIEEDSNGNPKFSFRKTKADAKYNPKDSEQPLRYILRFLLKLHIDGRQWKYLNFIRNWLGLDKELKEAVEEFAKGCKTTDGFTIMQGDKWINI